MNCWELAKIEQLQRSDEIGAIVNVKKCSIMWQSASCQRTAAGSTTIGEDRVPGKRPGSAGGAIKHRDMVFSSLKDEAVFIDGAGVATSRENKGLRYRPQRERRRAEQDR